jgi:AraC family transcriptional regulator of arabinose operon
MGDNFPSPLLASGLRLGRTYRTVGAAQVGCGWLDKTGWTRDIAWGVSQTYALVICLRGRGIYRDHRRRELPISAGIVFHRPTDRHHATTIEPGSGWIEAYIQFDPDLAATLHRHGCLGDGAVVHPATVDAAWLGDLIAAQRDLQRGTESDLGGVLGRLIALAAAACVRRPPAPASVHAAAIAAACTALAGGGRADALAGIAAEAGISPDRLRRIFRAATGLSPVAWRLRRSMDHAKGLLLEPGATVAGVAARLGYADAAAFSHAFRRTVGRSPAAWRRRAG